MHPKDGHPAISTDLCSGEHNKQREEDDEATKKKAPQKAPG
jgi:hypothetical protein